MKKHFDSYPDTGLIREKLIGMDEQTVRKSYYPELRRRLSELELFRGLLDQTNEAVFLADMPSCRIIDANGSACRQLEYTREQILRMTLPEVADMNPSANFSRVSGQETLIGYHEQEIFSTVLRSRQGKQLPVEITLRVAPFGNSEYIVAIARDISERLKAESELQAGEARLKAIVRGSPIPQFVIDRNHKVLYWNEALEIYSGIAAEDIVGTDGHWKAFYEAPRPCMADLLVDRRLEEIEQWYPEQSSPSILVEGAFEASGFFASMGPGGVWLHFTAAVICDEKGEIIGAVETLQDISRRMQAESALAASEEKYSTAFKYSSEAVGLIRLKDQRFIEVNDNFFISLGYQREEIIDHTSLEFNLWVLEPQREDAYRRLSEKGFFKDIEAIWRTQSGEHRVGLCSSEVAEISGDQYILFVWHDITERQKAEQERDGLRHLLQNIIDSMPTVLVGVDSKGAINQWNMEAERISGFSLADVRGRDIAEAFPFMVQCSESLEETLRHGTIPARERLSMVRDGTVRYFSITIYPLIGREIEGAVVLMDDITNKVRLDEIMIQNEKMLSVGGLAAGMAHEINNPLGGIIQGIQNVMRRFDPDSPKNIETAQASGIDLGKVQEYMRQRQITEFLNGIQQSGLRASKIVKNMLMFSRASQCEKSLHWLDALLERSLELASSDYDLRKQYDFRHIEIIREYEPDMAAVLCSDTEIEQVLLNLMKNAAQAMQGMASRNEPPRLILRCGQESSMAVIEVEDNGPGMSDAVKRRIFEPFYTTKAAGEGTGLGLSVAYFIITQNHNGQMFVESAPSRGARFIIKLPFPEPGPATLQVNRSTRLASRSRL